MIQVIKQEWEITKTYIFDVVLRDGMIRLDWNDFEMRARENKPSVAVRVDEPLNISGLTEKAIDEMERNINGTLSIVMVVFSYKKDHELLMEELGGMNDTLERLANKNVDIIWGVQQTEEISNNRCITLFAFEKL